MWAKLIHLILRLFGLIKNPVKQPKDDAPTLPDDKEVKALPPVEEAEEPPLPEPEPEEPPKNKPQPKPPTEWEQRWAVMQEMLDRPFDGPLDALPTRRYGKTTKLANGAEKVELGVYDVYGRAPKESGNKKYPKAKLKVHEKLPGSWNKGRPRLYMEERVGEYFREGLSRAGEMEERVSEIKGEEYKVLSYMYSIGAYSHRHIRHNPKNQLSYHSWAIAFDQNPGWNRGVTRYKKWQRRVKKNGKKVWVDCAPGVANRGPINTVLPFSKQFWEVFPKSMPLELFVAFTSVGFSCGLNWGRMKWFSVIQKFGEGFDQEDPQVKSSREFSEAMTEWKNFSYYDAMHYELTTRGAWMRAVWDKNQKRIEEGIVD